MNSVRSARVGVAVLAFLVALAAPAIAATDSATLSNGAQLSVTLDPAGSGGTFLIPAGDTDVDVPFTGEASVGKGAPSVHWTYVIDVSGSTAGPCGNGTSILACEKAAVSNLNNAVVADGSALDVGLTVFASSGASADMSAAAGNQPLNAPDADDVDTVIASVVVNGVGQFNPQNVGNLTNYTAGLLAAATSVNASSATSKNVVFLSDGLPNDGGGGFDAAVAALGATIYSFAVGVNASCTSGGVNGTLQSMADATGGTCTEVENPVNLPGIVQNVTDTELSSVSLTGATLDAPLALPADGPVTVPFAATAAGLTPGTHEVCAEATGLGPKSDATSESTVEACEDVHVFDFSLAPATETNELGVDNEHTVTATVDGPATMLEGLSVDFAVTGQNSGETGTCVPATCTTGADGVVTFTYDVPVAPTSLGIDTISATVTIADDVTGTLEVEKEWVDTTPPVATCEPGPNPSGKIPAAPGRGGQAQNPDGFYTISAVDDVWGALDVDLFVTDDVSLHVFGAFGNPTNIKYVQAPGATPSQSPGSGAVDWNLKGKGDAVLTAVDGSGNTSDAVNCLVPPPPQ